jgi:hypothetical protein
VFFGLRIFANSSPTISRDRKFGITREFCVGVLFRDIRDRKDMRDERDKKELSDKITRHIFIVPFVPRVPYVPYKNLTV